MRKKENILNPWAGLSSYEDPAKSSRKLKFCGRDSDTFDVTRLIDDNFFVTLYGKSGIGKTSLLNAGVFPALRREQYTPLMLRLGMTEEGENFQNIITTAIERAVREMGGLVKVIPVVEEQTDSNAIDYMWNWFARHQFLTADEQITFPMVVFDQFEEVFRQSESRAKTELLLAQLHYLIDESHAIGDCIVEGESYSYDFNFRFVLSIREDDLYRLEDSIDNCALTALKRCRYRLRSLSEEGARSAILIPGEDLFRPEEQNQIVQTIIGIARNKEEQNISTNLLSLVCNRIFVDFQKKTDADFISLSLVDTFLKGNPFERFYEEATKGFSNKEKGYIEDHLVDSTGHRNSMPESDFLLHVPSGTKLLEGDTRILQRSSVSTDGGNYRIELIHDSFCEPLSRQKEKREKRRRRHLMLATAGGMLLCVGITMFIFYLSQRNRIQEGTIAQQDKDLELKNEQLQQEKDAALQKAQELADALGLIDEKNSELEQYVGELILERNRSQLAMKSMLENRARYIAEKGQELIDDHDSYTAQLLALFILPDLLDKPNKPYVVEAEELLRNSVESENGVLRGHQQSVKYVAINPNGTRIASVDDADILIVWDTRSGSHLDRPPIKLTDGIRAVTFSQSGDSIITFFSDTSVRIWNTETGNQIGQPFKGKANDSSLVFFNYDGKRKVLKDGRYVHIYDVATGKQIGDTLKHDGTVFSAVFSHDGKRIVSAAQDNTVRIWDAATGKQIGEPLKGHTGYVFSAVFSSDGKRIVSGSEDKTVRIWDIDTVEKMEKSSKSIGGYIRSASFSPDGKWIVSEDNEGNVRIHEVETGKEREIGKSCKSEKNITSDVFSPDGKRIIVNDGHDILIWDAEEKQQIRLMKGGDFYVFSPDGKRIMLFDNAGNLYVRDVETDKQICNPIQGNLDKTVIHAVFSSDGKRIASLYEDNTMIVWNVETGEKNSPILKWFRKSAAAFSPDGKTIVWQRDQKTISLLDIERQIVENIEGDFEDIYSVSFFINGKRRQIVSAHIDGKIRVWDAETGKQLCEPIVGSKTGAVSAEFSKDGKQILSVYRDGTLSIWDFPPLQDLINETRKRFKNRQLTPEERKKYYLE